jgi:DNA topoisomerase-3
MKVVVAEKPSVARDLARVLGAGSKRDGFIEGPGLRITWCIGHLLELEDPGHYAEEWKAWRLDQLPMVPPRFDLRVRSGIEDQWAVVQRLLKDREVQEVINACDAGREGELIFRYAYQHAGCRAPVRRFWASSMTDAAVRAAWDRLQPSSRFDALAAAARCRAEADWLVGLNVTRAMTCRTRDAGGDALWSVGRVQTPTLAMIVGRDREIAAFVPETFWQVRARIEAEKGGWQATWFRPEVRDAKEEPEGDEVPSSQRLGSAQDAERIVRACQGRPGEVEQARRREKREPPPLLYDLTSLQRRANQRYGLSAQRTLEVAQALYERHKLITYPRTDARYLTSDQVAELPSILRGVAGLAVYAPFAQALLAAPIRPGSRVVNDAEVGDHHAILPTDRTPVAASLNADEKRIYDLVVRRLLAVLSPEAIFDLTDLVVAVPCEPSALLPDGVASPLRFRARGRVCRQEGWRAVDPPSARRDVDLPGVDVGDPVRITKAESEEDQTKPPRPHDDASLLKAMETAGRQLEQKDLARAMRNAGLGTPATRAAIVQTLLDRGYVVRDKRALLSTEQGRALIEAMPADELLSPVLTGRWELRLAEMAEGREDRVAFMADVVKLLEQIIGAIRVAALPQAALVRTRPQAEPLGACPACGQPVRERGKVYACDTGRACVFVVFGEMSKRKISKRLVIELLTKGRTKPVKGFKNKAGAEFTAGLMVEEGKVRFWFPDREGEEAPPKGPTAPKPPRPAAAAAPAPPAARSEPSRGPVGLSCPACQEGRILAGRSAWGCSRWREGCRWRLDYEIDGRALGMAEAVARVERAR